jgi:N-acyl-D-aspartate/D-glutamate deacylase
MAYDLVIKGGEVVDGTGAARYRADVGIQGGVVRTIGAIDDTGCAVLDAEGHLVTPGFIDAHTHMDAQIFWDPGASCSSWHGVTTAVIGNCGFTLAPCAAEDKDLVLRNLEKAEDIPAAALKAGIPDWRWDTFSSFLDVVEALPKGINYSAQIGHSALRTWAMGERAFDEAAGEDDLAAMERELESAVRAGAIGFTTSRSNSHETPDGTPVASRVAQWSEFVRLVHVLGRLGTGMVEMATETVATGRDKGLKQDWFDRLLTLVRDTRVPTSFGVFGIDGDPASWMDTLAFLDRAAAEGVPIFGQTHSRDIAYLPSFQTTLPFDGLPVWRDIRALPHDEQRAKLMDAAVRAALVRSAEAGPYKRTPNFEQIEIVTSGMPGTPSVARAGRERGAHPVEVMIDLALETEFKQFFRQPSVNTVLEDVFTMMTHPHTVMTFSDSGAHVSYICDASVHTILLGYWARERQRLTFEEAVRMVTSVPAQRWGFAGRGVLNEGAIADINVIDPETVGPKLPELVHDLPGGARRVIQDSTGIKATLVGGTAIRRDGVTTGQTPGHLIRGPLHAR